MMELIQGEGGVMPLDKEYVKQVRKLCDEKDILLILDEIQCGMGRSGKMFAYEHFGIKPDIVTVAKALGCGVTVGAFVAGEKAEKSLVPGDHGSTYGGNPLATAAANAVFDLFEKKNILENVNRVGAYLEQQLLALKEKYSFIIDARGMGLIRGIEFTCPVGEIVSKCIANGLLVISAEANTIRFVPPLVITEENVDEMISILDGVLAQVQA
jgi:acetylornithine/N-succinyldiaminopimelate aminotransferase